MGRRASRQIEMAALSITFRLSSMARWKVTRSRRLAAGSFFGSAVYTPSTLVPFSTASAPISAARRAAAESVVK